MLPVIVGVDRESVIGAELFDCETAVSLFLKYSGPFGKIDLVKFLFCVHEIILLFDLRELRESRDSSENIWGYYLIGL